MKRQLLPLFVTLGGLAAVFSVVLLFSIEPAAARPAEFALDELALEAFDAGQRSVSEAPQSDVRVRGPEYGQRPKFKLEQPNPPYPVGSLMLHVNYAHDWVAGNAEVEGVTVAVTVTTFDDSPKADAVVSTMAGGDFFVGCEAWTSGNCPDIVPGDKVFAEADGVPAEINPVGHISGQLNVVTDVVTGTLMAPGPGSRDVICQVWGEPGSAPIPKSAAAGGGTFTCNFVGEAGWDLMRGDQVALIYDEGDGDLVSNIVPWPWARANYAHDWAGMNYEMGHTFWLTVTDSVGAVKATAVAESTSGGGWGEPGFDTQSEQWAPEQPDIAPGDWVYFAADDGYANALQVGEISGDVDAAADTVTGTVVAPSFSVSLTVDCHPWGAWDVGIDAPVKEGWAEPDGSVPYSCSWNPATEWDVQAGQDIGVMYIEPDDDRIINVVSEPAAHLGIEKWAEGEAGQDGNFVYRVRYWNDGDAPAENVVITDTTLGGLTYLGDTSGFSHTGSGSGPIVLQLGTVDPGIDSFFDIYFEITVAPPERITNTVQIATSSADRGEPWEKVSEWGTQVQPNDTHLSIGKDSWTGDPAPGEDLIFVLHVCNNGGTASDFVDLVDDLHPLLTLQAWWSDDLAWVESYRDPGRLELAHPSIQGNWCSEVYLRASVAPDAKPGDHIDNLATLSSLSDLSPDDNEAYWEGNVNDPRANLRIEKSLESAVLVPGGVLNYRIHYENNGNVPVGPIMITDTLPVSTTFIEARHDGPMGDFDFPPDVQTAEYLAWLLPGLENGFHGEFTVVLAVDPDAAPGTVLVNGIEISPVPDEDDYGDNADEVVEDVRPSGPNLRVRKWHDWQGEGQLGYQVHFQNLGDVPIPGVWLTDTLPPGTTSDGWFDLGFDWDRLLTSDYLNGSRTFIWLFDELNPGDSGWLNFNADLDEPGQPLRWYTNTVEITIPDGETWPSDNYFEDIAFSGAEARRVEFWLNQSGPSGMWGEAVPGYPITVTTPVTQVYAWADPGCDGCWNIDNAGLILPGDLVMVEAGEAIMPVAVTIPDPLDAEVDTGAGAVFGVIGGWSERPVEVHGNWPGGYQVTPSDPAGNFLALFSDMPRGADGYIRFIDQVDYAEVIFHRPFQALDLILNVNYGDDWVEGAYEPGHTVWITVTESDGSTVKGLAELHSDFLPDWDGQSGFSTNWEGWMGQPPDIVPGDWVFGRVDNGFASEVEVGTITGVLNLGASSVEGQMFAPWAEMLNAWCGVWVPDGPGFEFMVDPAGGPYLCDFSPWVLTPGQPVGVRYQEPDGDWVGNVFQEPVPYLRIEKWADDEPAENGALRFTIEYWNEGDGPAGEVVISDVMLGGMVYITDTSGLPRSGDGSGPIVWDAGLVEPGPRQRFDVFVGITAVASQTITNTALIETSSPWDQGEPWEKQAVWEGHVIENDTFLSVDKHAWTGDPAPGHNLIFEVNVCNNGNTSSGEVLLTDNLGPGLFLVDWWPGQPGWFEISSDPGQLVVATPSVSGHSCSQVLLEAFLDPGVELGTLISNTALIESSSDLSPDDNIAEWEGQASPEHANLGINKWFNWGQLVPGGEVSYNINFFNNGNVAVGPFLVTDTLPVGATFAGSWVHDDQGEHPLPPVVVTDDYVVWEFPGLRNGFNFDFEVRVVIDGDAPPGMPLVNQVNIQPQPEEDTYEDNEDVWTEVVNDHGPNLRVHKWGQWDDWGPDTRQGAYWIRIENIGDVRIDGVVMTDTYPAEMVFSEGPDTEWWRLLDWWDDPGNHMVTAVFDYLEPGEATWFNFAAIVPGEGPLPFGLTFGNLVEVEPAPGEVELHDNVAEWVLTTGPDLYVEKGLVDRGLLPGDLVTFSLTFGNDRDEREWWWGLQAPAVMTDTLPEGLEYVSAMLLNCGPEGQPCPFDPLPGDGRTLVWELWPFGPRESAELLLTVRIGEDAQNGDVYQNHVEILSAVPELDVEPDYDNNEDTYNVWMSLPDFEIDKLYESSRLPKATVTYTLRFSNVGAMAASGLVISDQLPSNVTWLSGGSYDASSQSITWTWPSLAAGSGAEVQFSGQLACSGVVANDRYLVVSSDQRVSGPLGPEIRFNIVKPTIAVSFTHSADPVAGAVTLFQAVAGTNGPGPLSYEWDFGDGMGSDGSSPFHVYKADGGFTVVLTATDLCGYQASHSALVDVDPPTIAAGFDQSDGVVPIHSTIQFTDTSTTNGADISGWLWDFGDGTPKSSLQDPSHTYDGHGTYTVTLVVTDALGYEDTIVKTNAVITLAPVFEIGKAFESSRVAGSAVTYTLVVTNVGDLTGTGLVITDRLPSNVTWVSGGTYDSGIVSWTWPSLAVGHTAQMQFSGQLGCSGQALNDRYRVSASDQGVTSLWGDPVSLAIAAPAIVAEFNQSASVIMPLETVYFTSTSTTNGPALNAFNWDFGDGETGKGATADNQFRSPGLFDVELTVTDACGYQDTVSHTVSVKFVQLIPIIIKP